MTDKHPPLPDRNKTPATSQHSGLADEGHMHLHQHADGTIHNHLHLHADKHDHDALPTGRPVVTTQNIAFAYPGAQNPVFQNIQLSVEAGSVLAILGNNGAGKSTLLNLLAGIAKPSTGQVYVGQTDLATLNRRQTAKHIAYVAQQQKIPHLTVYDQVLMGRKPHLNWSLSSYDRSVVAKVIEWLGLEAFTTRYLDELSGGERQKVLIARALAQEPEVLLLDEPTSALDLKNQMEVLDIIRSITQQSSLATVLVIHDVNLALRFCNRFLLMHYGEVIAQGGIEVATAQNLSLTYNLDVRIEHIDGIPVVIPCS